MEQTKQSAVVPCMKRATKGRLSGPELAEQQRVLLRQGMSILERGEELGPRVHVFAQDAEYALIVSDLMRDEAHKSVLIEFVRSFAAEHQAYATIFLFESWVAVGKVADAMMRRRAAGETVLPMDMPGRGEAVMAMLESDTGCWCCSADIHRGENGRVTFTEKPASPAEDGRMTGFLNKVGETEEEGCELRDAGVYLDAFLKWLRDRMKAAGLDTLDLMKEVEKSGGVKS